MDDYILDAAQKYRQTLDDRAFRASHVNLNNYFEHLLLAIENDIRIINEEEVWESQMPVEWKEASGGAMVAAKTTYPSVHIYISNSEFGVDVKMVTKESPSKKEFSDSYGYPVKEQGKYIVLIDDYGRSSRREYPIQDAGAVILRPIVDAIVKSLEID